MNALLGLAETIVAYTAVVFVMLAVWMSELISIVDDNLQYVIAALIVGALLVSAYLSHRHYMWRLRYMMWYWLRKIGEIMPHGTKDDHSKSVVSQACYEAIFDLAVTKKISWRKERYYNDLLAMLFDSDSMRRVKTHRGAIRNTVEKNIKSMKATPVVDIPGPPKPADSGLKFLKKRREA